MTTNRTIRMLLTLATTILLSSCGDPLKSDDFDGKYEIIMESCGVESLTVLGVGKVPGKHGKGYFIVERKGLQLTVSFSQSKYMPIPSKVDATIATFRETISDTVVDLKVNDCKLDDFTSKRWIAERVLSKLAKPESNKETSLK